MSGAAAPVVEQLAALDFDIPCEYPLDNNAAEWVVRFPCTCDAQRNRALVVCSTCLLHVIRVSQHPQLRCECGRRLALGHVDPVRRVA